VNVFSLDKDPPISFEKGYIIFGKIYMIHTLIPIMN